MAQGVDDRVRGGASSVAYEFRLEALTGVLSMVAVRLIQMRELGRHVPNRLASGLVAAGPLALVQRARRGRGRPEDWRIGELLCGLAGLGGFLGCMSDGEPGWMTIWPSWDASSCLLRGDQLAGQPPDH